MFEKDYVVFDLETTGLNSLHDEIIEIGLVRISRGEIVDKATWLVNPGFPLPKIIPDITGITDEMLRDKPSMNDITHEVEAYFLGADIIAHNIEFDLGFLSKHIPSLVSKLSYDTLELAKIILPTAANYTLENLAQEFQLPIANLHRAGDDALLTANLFLKLYDIAAQTPIDALLMISKIFNDDSPIKRFFEEALKEKVRNSVVGERKSFLRTLHIVPKLHHDTDEDYIINSDEILPWFDASSPLADNNPYFEVRAPQIAMAKGIIKTLNAKEHIVIEAGTGTGKSLAYLLPAAKYAWHSGKKVAIATNTISLQEQLLTKDIPQLHKLGLEARVALIKGRSHYLCLRKVFAFEDTDNLTAEEALALAKITFWLTKTETGDKNELNYSPKANNLWRTLASDTESCVGPKCKWYSKQCYFTHARRSAELADILVINHALLLSDCSSEKKILPIFNHLIIDEAHHLDRIASEYLGDQCDFIELGYNLQRLLSHNKNEGYSILGKIRKQMVTLSEYERYYPERLLKSIDELYYIQEEIRGLLNQVKDAFYRLMVVRHSDDNDFRQILRIKPTHLTQPLWLAFLEIGQALVIALTSYFKNLNKFLNDLNDFPNELAEKEHWQFEMTNYMQYFRGCINTLTVFFTPEVAQEIKWLEYDSDLKNTFVCKYVPYDIGIKMKNALYDNCETIIFTSATLTVERNFNYFLDNTGLNLLSDKVKTLALGSTFDYEKQTLVAVPSDIGNPQLNESKFLHSSIKFIEDIYQTFRGRTLVLFTSHKQLRYVYENINLPDDVLLLGQSISGSRQKLLESFCLNENACLLGANTFWEGIDLPGDLLKLLIIVKLPFLPPTYPLLEARVEKAEEAGQNAFGKVTLPGAVIRFKQGFGRLIRKKHDTGVVIILDGRVTAKRYGLTFLRSLPIKSFFTDNKGEVILKVMEWFSKKC